MPLVRDWSVCLSLLVWCLFLGCSFVVSSLISFPTTGAGILSWFGVAHLVDVLTFVCFVAFCNRRMGADFAQSQSDDAARLHAELFAFGAVELLSLLVLLSFRIFFRK